MMNQLQTTNPAPHPSGYSEASLAAADPGAAFDLFDQAAARFLATRKTEATARRYKVHLDNYRALCEASGALPLSGDALITFNASVTHQGKPNGQDFSNDTKRAYLKTVQSFFSWCYTFGLTQLKPELVAKEFIHLPEARRLSPRDLLSEDEAQRLLHAARFFPADLAIITLMLSAGLRLSEVLALTAADVYQAGGRCFVKVEKGKGGKSREVPVTLATWETIQDYAAAWPPDGLLFADHYPRRVQRLLTKHARRAGIEKNVTPHALRHTYANKLAELGAPIELIGELLGHASYDTTKIYTRPGELLRRAALPELPW